MKQWTGREFARLAERHGWRLLRIKGSHHIYGKPGTVVRLSIPVHGSEALKMGLLKHLSRSAGIPDDDLC